MATLWNRATPPQYRMLRAIAGAVANAAHAHHMDLPRHFARSVAKRATGTLTGPDMLTKEMMQERVLNLVIIDKESECWITKGRTPYGRIKIGKKRYLLHRFSYEVFIGPIPDGFILRHSCDNDLCSNPKHLVPGTHQQNSEDRESRGRSNQNPLRGSIHPRAKLNEDAIFAIREMSGTNLSISKDFGVSESLVQQIRTRKRWGHLPDCNSISGVLAATVNRRQKGLRGETVPREPRGSGLLEGLSKGDRLGLVRRSPLRALWKRFAAEMWKVKREGAPEQYAAFVRILQLLDQAQQELANLDQQQRK